MATQILSTRSLGLGAGASGIELDKDAAILSSDASYSGLGRDATLKLLDAQ
jgi:hypothetical protein